MLNLAKINAKPRWTLFYGSDCRAMDNIEFDGDHLSWDLNEWDTRRVGNLTLSLSCYKPLSETTYLSVITSPTMVHSLSS